MSLLDIDHYKREFEREMLLLRERVMRGERAAIFTAMELFFRGAHMGVASVCPAWLASAALIPLNEFAEGKCEHLEHAFGIAVRERRANDQTRRVALDGHRVYEAVEAAVRRGFARDYRANSAFFEAARSLGYAGSAKTLGRIYDEYRQRLAEGRGEKSTELAQHFDKAKHRL